MRNNTNKPHLSKTKKIVYVVCSLVLILFFIVYLNKEYISNAACKKEDFRTVLVKSLYNFTDEQLRDDDVIMFIIVGKSISKSELYNLFDTNKEATIKAIKNTYPLKNIRGFHLPEVFKLQDDNIAYTLIFPGGDGGMYSIYPSNSFLEKKEAISTEVYTFNITNKKDFLNSKELMKKGRLKTYKLTYSVTSCNTLKYHSTEHDK